MTRPCLFISALALLFSSCYSFSGASVPTGAKTIQIEYFQNRALTVNPALSDLLTDKVRSYTLSRINLIEVDMGADLQLSGEITSYDLGTQGTQSNATALENKLTVSIKVRYINNLNPKDNFTRSFSRYRLFSSQLSLAQVENDLIVEIVEELATDIFDGTFSNW